MTVEDKEVIESLNGYYTSADVRNKYIKIEDGIITYRYEVETPRNITIEDSGKIIFPATYQKIKRFKLVPIEE